jgi:hypothetical protein
MYETNTCDYIKLLTVSHIITCVECRIVSSVSINVS